MTTEDLIEQLIDLSYYKYKKLSKGCREFDLLNRKIPVTIDNIEFTGWREYTCYKVCEYIKSKIPEAELDLELNGNDSVITLSMSDEDKRTITMKLWNLIQGWKEI